MSPEKKKKSFSNPLCILLCIAACLTSLHAAKAQQRAASNHFGGTLPSASPATRERGPERTSVSGGGSNWSAGQGSFGTAVQPGGVWRDESTLPAVVDNAGSATQVHSSAKGVFPSSSVLEADSFTQTATSVRRNAASGPAHLSHFSAGLHSGLMSASRSPVLRSSTMRPVAGVSRNETGSRSRGRAESKSELASGQIPNGVISGQISSSVHTGPVRNPISNSSLYTSQKARFKKRQTETQP